MTADKDMENGEGVEIVPLPAIDSMKAGERRRSTRPVLFEQAARGWWNPRYSSMSLENEYQKLSFPQTRRRFRYALIYVMLACVSWCAFFAMMRRAHWGTYLVAGLVLLIATGVVMALTFWSEMYGQRRCMLATSVIHTALLFIFALLPFMYIVDFPDMSSVGMFTTAVEILLLIYTVIPLPFYASIGFGLVFSVAFELLNAFTSDMKTPEVILGRALLHVCIHIIGIHVSIMTQVRRRSTFLKVGQSVMIRHDLAKEKNLKERMIESLMPPAVAEKARREMEGLPEDDGRGEGDRRPQIFRALHVSDMPSVSILFADIVGFTHMSSNKTAPHLVSLLNDLFGRFDVLCKKNNCEKISTLGDCYYCVAGCPTPRPDHAKCCVDMGLAMCVAIQEFDSDHNEEVNMRVGVHTGTVLCGLVGVRRFKFDVWSHDVTLANLMESSGKAGRVHISHDTYQFVKDIYETEPGEPVEDIRKDKKLEERFDRGTQKFVVGHVLQTKSLDTWFVVRPKTETAGGGGHNSASPATVTVTLDDTTHSQIEPDAVSVPLMTQLEPTAEVDFEMDTDVALVDQLQKQRQLREKEKTDKHIVQCMERDNNVHSYLYQPPINVLTFNFLDPQVESDFRNHFFMDEVENVPTLALPRYSLFSDLTVALIFFIFIAVCLFLALPASPSWVVFFIVAVLLLLVPVVCALLLVCRYHTSCLMKPGCALMRWYPRQAIGAILASLPAIGVYMCFSCPAFNKPDTGDIFYCLCLIVSLLHFLNFTLLSCWLKSALATVCGIIMLILLFFGVCGITDDITGADFNSHNLSQLYTTTEMVTMVTLTPNRTDADQVFAGDHPLRYEIFLNVGLLLILIWFLNCEFEINYRLSFYGNVQAKGDREKMEVEKKQADMLLHNIIPMHVWEALKKSKKSGDGLRGGEGDEVAKDVVFGEKHEKVGVIFARITNFDELYEEGYEGGKEFLRVLNQIMSEFEMLLDADKYKDIEKIKTIGSCLMAASGMNPVLREQNKKDPNAHLYALMDFAIELLHTLEEFNKDMMNFHFEMCIGYNFGDVVAGVVGKTKLLYDIWGDTVNIASRMYSTGEHDRIQVTEEVAKALSDKFEFEKRGTVFVKGKGDMNVSLLVKKKPGASWY